MNDISCGIITDRGDCHRQSVPGIPLNLCREHLSEAAHLYTDLTADQAPIHRIDGRCEKCNALSLVAKVTTRTIRCTMCGHEKHADIQPYTNALNPAKAIDPRAEIVYYIRFGDRIKIGTTQNLQARLKALPHDEVLAVERGGRDVESRRHRQFQQHRVTPHSEWFTINDDLTTHIARLRDIVGTPTDVMG